MEALACLTGRRSVGRLVEPAPSDDELATLLQAAVAAPDHGRLRPWRFVVVDGPGLDRLGAAYAAAHAEREPGAGADAWAAARDKPRRAPLIVAVVARPTPARKVPDWEQLASAACAAYGICLAAHALGYGAMWRTGWYGDAPAVRELLGLADRETVAGWIYLGTVPDDCVPAPRPPADLGALVTRL